MFMWAAQTYAIAYNIRWIRVWCRTSILASQWKISIGKNSPPQSFNNAATYVNQDGVAIGYAWTATNVDLQPQPILAGLINVPIPAMLGVVILGLMVFLMRGKIRLEKNENGKGFRLTVEIWLRESNKKENPS